MDYSYMYRCSHNESRREEAGDGFSHMEEVSADVVLDLDTATWSQDRTLARPLCRCKLHIYKYEFIYMLL